MLENDKGDEGGGAMTPLLDASSAGAEPSSSYTFAGKASDSPVGHQRPVIHFIDGQSGVEKLKQLPIITLHLVRLRTSSC